MDRKQLQSAAASYTYFKGLFAIPGGLLAIVAALGNWEWGPLRHTWVFLAAVLVLAATCVPIARYYDEHYGRATLSTRLQARAAVVVVLGAPLVFGTSTLLRSRADWSLDLPVNPTAASLALLMLASYAAGGVLRRHHVIVFGALLVAGLLPVWNGADPSNVGLFLAGIAFIVTGILDHRLLVRTFGPASGLRLENKRCRSVTTS
jgi:hypothetical protein